MGNINNILPHVGRLPFFHLTGIITRAFSEPKGVNYLLKLNYTLKGMKIFSEKCLFSKTRTSFIFLDLYIYDKLAIWYFINLTNRMYADFLFPNRIYADLRLAISCTCSSAISFSSIMCVLGDRFPNLKWSHNASEITNCHSTNFAHQVSQKDQLLHYSNNNLFYLFIICKFLWKQIINIVYK